MGFAALIVLIAMSLGACGSAPISEHRTVAATPTPARVTPIRPICGHVDPPMPDVTRSLLRETEAVAPDVAALMATTVQPLSYQLRRDVVVSDTHAFVLGGDGGIDAINLATGELTWHSDHALLPLHAHDGTLIAVGNQARPMTIVALAVLNGSLQRTCGSVAVPAWVQVSPVDGMGSAFEVFARAAADKLTVQWTASTQYVGGVPPSEAMRAAADHHVAGTFVVSLPSCKVTAVRQRGDAPTSTNHGLELPYTSGPVTVGDVVVNIEATEDHVSISRSIGGAVQPSSQLPSPVGLALSSIDHAYLLIVDPLGEDGAFRSATLFDTRTGTQLATIAFGPNAPETFVVVGPKVIYAVDTELRVIDVAQSSRSFTRTLRSTAYIGTYPPSMPSGPAQRPGNPRSRGADEPDLL